MAGWSHQIPCRKNGFTGFGGREVPSGYQTSRSHISPVGMNGGCVLGGEELEEGRGKCPFARTLVKLAAALKVPASEIVARMAALLAKAPKPQKKSSS